MMSENLHSVFRVIAITAAALGAVVITTATPCHEAQASTSVAVTVNDLATAAEIVARVTPIERTSAWEDGRIVTTTKVHVDQVIAGAGAASELRIRTRGGVVGDVGQYVEGEAEMTTGKPAVVFLAKNGAARGNAGVMSVVGRAQGRWIVSRESARDVVRVRGLGNVVDRRALGPVPRRGTLVTELDGASFDDATRAITRAWSETHAR